MLRSLLLISVTLSFGACELKPGPSKQAEPPPAAGSGSGSGSAIPAPPPPPPPTPAPVAETPPAATPPAMAQPSEACQRVAVHIADVLISLAQPPQKAVMEQDRTKLVRQAGISCQKNAWTDDKIACFNVASTQESFDTCNRMPNKG